MTRPAWQLHVIEAAASPAVPTRLQRSKTLARAMAKEARARAALEQAQREVDAAFGPWAAGRTIGRDEAQRQLASLGFLPEVKL